MLSSSECVCHKITAVLLSLRQAQSKKCSESLKCASVFLFKFIQFSWQILLSLLLLGWTTDHKAFRCWIKKIASPCEVVSCQHKRRNTSRVMKWRDMFIKTHWAIQCEAVKSWLHRARLATMSHCSSPVHVRLRQRESECVCPRAIEQTLPLCCPCPCWTRQQHFSLWPRCA